MLKNRRTLQSFIYLSLTYILHCLSVGQPVDSRRLYANQWGDDLQHLVIETIDKAKESLLIYAYQIYDENIFQAIERAVKRNVHVEMVLDRNLAKKNRYVDLGIIPLIAKKVQHLKAIVCDHRTIIFSSANFTFEGFRLQPNASILIQEPLFAELLYQKKEWLKNVKAKVIHNQIDSHGNELWILPNANALKRMIDLIENAKVQIQCALFSFTSKDLLEALILAHQRGIDVHLFLDSSQAQGAGRSTIAAIQMANLPFSIIRPIDVMHHKFALIDDQLLIGSLNWSKQGLERNIDGFIMLNSLHYEEKRILQWLIRDLKLLKIRH